MRVGTVHIFPGKSHIEPVAQEKFRPFESEPHAIRFKET